jgi:hypothetical protein
MLYCLLYLLCPRMYHDLFVVPEQRVRDRFPGSSSTRDEFEELYIDRPAFVEIPLQS